MKISLQRGAALGLRVTGVHARLVVVPVTGIPSRPMFGPGTYKRKHHRKIGIETRRKHTHAHPTELILALLASHMADKVDSFASYNAVNGERDSLAATVFLNGTLTLATLLGIAFDPVCSLTVIPAFLQPHPRDGA
jgi:hypothetical protein